MDEKAFNKAKKRLFESLEYHLTYSKTATYQFSAELGTEDLQAIGRHTPGIIYNGDVNIRIQITDPGVRQKNMEQFYEKNPTLGQSRFI